MADTSNRGLASASQETRERVARAGGRASRGGGRKGRKGGQSSQGQSGGQGRGS